MQNDERHGARSHHRERRAGLVPAVAARCLLTRAGLRTQHLQQGLLRPRLLRIRRGRGRAQVC